MSTALCKGVSIPKYTPKQIEKYRRRKYMAALEKIAKNLYKMFRNANTDMDTFVSKFETLFEGLKELEEPYLDSEYHRHLKAYIFGLYRDIVKEKNIDKDTFVAMKEREVSKLNRLQKTKAATTYKKEKHKRYAIRNEWE